MSAYRDQGSISEMSIHNDSKTCNEDDLEMTCVIDYFNVYNPDNGSKGVGCINNINSEDNLLLPIYEQIGCLRYLADRSRPDLLYPINYLSRFMNKPNEAVLIELHRLLRYINQTKNFELVVGGSEIELFAMADSSHVQTGDTKSQMGYAIYLGRLSGSVCSFSKRATTVALSSTQAETDSLAECVKEITWFQGFLRSIELECKDTIKIWIDNHQVQRSGNSEEGSQKKSKHNLIKVNYIHEQVCNKLIELCYVSTSENHSDLFTKALNGTPLKKHTEGILGDGYDNNDTL
jgi:hypothetical protein